MGGGGFLCARYPCNPCTVGFPGTAVGYDEEKNEWEECADFHLPEPLAGFSLCSL